MKIITKLIVLLGLLSVFGQTQAEVYSPFKKGAFERFWEGRIQWLDDGYTTNLRSSSRDTRDHYSKKEGIYLDISTDYSFTEHCIGLIHSTGYSKNGHSVFFEPVSHSQCNNPVDKITMTAVNSNLVRVDIFKDGTIVAKGEMWPIGKAKPLVLSPPKPKQAQVIENAQVETDAVPGKYTPEGIRQCKAEAGAGNRIVKCNVIPNEPCRYDYYGTCKDHATCRPKSQEAYSCEAYLETFRYYVKDIHCDSVTKNIGFTKEIVLDEICSKR